MAPCLGRDVLQMTHKLYRRRLAHYLLLTSVCSWLSGCGGPHNDAAGQQSGLAAQVMAVGAVGGLSLLDSAAADEALKAISADESLARDVKESAKTALQ